MNKIIIALGLALAASTGAYADSTALDVYDFPAAQGNANYAVGVSNDLVTYERAGNDGSPTFTAPQGGIDYTATASVGGDVDNGQVTYDRAGNDGSPRYK